MMAIDFPAAPSEGQTFVQGTVRYTFTGGVWTAAPLGTAQPFNYVINPNFMISQQNGRNVLATNGAYPADQWIGSFAATLTATVASEDWPDVYMMAGNVKTPLLASELAYLTQIIEGSRVADLCWGTAGARDAVFRLKAWATGGTGGTAPLTFGVSVRSTQGTLMSFAQTFSITALEEWQEFSMAIPGPTTGTWPADNAPSISLFVTAAAGSTYVTPTPGAWATGNFISGPGVNLFTNLNRILFVTDVGLYQDYFSTGRAPPFEAPSGRQLMSDCQRYWYQLRHARGVVSNATAASRMGTRHPVTMRSAPACAVVGAPVVYDTGSAPAVSSIPSIYASPDYAELDMSAAGGAMTMGRGVIFTSVNASNYIAVSART
jgi:hypothetical protein